MLALKPNCELCDRDLPPDSEAAMICSYECTFCEDCVRRVLQDVCPNCGGNFSHRPIRPAQEHRAGVSLAQQPASVERVISQLSRSDIATLVQSLAAVPPAQR